MSDAERVERLLKLAFAPVEPPEALSDRLERGLTEMADAAADQLAEWELSAMSDPRNWVRPAAAMVVGTVAAGGLVLVRARQQQKKRQGSGLRALERSLRDVPTTSRSGCGARAGGRRRARLPCLPFDGAATGRSESGQQRASARA